MMLHDGGNKMTLSFLGAYMGPCNQGLVVAFAAAARKVDF